MRGDQASPSATGADVAPRAATPYAVSRCHSRPSTRPRRRTDAVGNDRASQATVKGSSSSERTPRRDPVRRRESTSTARAPSRGGHPRVDRAPPDAGVELGTGHGVPWSGNEPPGRGSSRPGRSRRPQAQVPGVTPHPVPQAEPVQLGDGAGGQAVPAGLVAGKHRRVGEHHVVSRAGRPGRRGRSGRAGADHGSRSMRGRGHRHSLASRCGATGIAPASFDTVPGGVERDLASAPLPPLSTPD